MADWAVYRFPIEEAGRLASLGGIEQDLRGVVAYCDKLVELSDIEKFNTIEWEAISAAAVVRYARCFSCGVRDWLEHSLFDTADTELKSAHEHFIAVRNKHFAHSVNPFEENEVTVQIASHFQSSAEITSTGLSHNRIVGLSFGHPELLKQLTEWLLVKVEEEMTIEKARLLFLAQQRPLAELRAYGMPTAREFDVRMHASRSRKAP